MLEGYIGYKLNCTNIHSPRVVRDILRTPNFGRKSYYMLKAYLTGEFATIYPDKVEAAYMKRYREKYYKA